MDKILKFDKYFESKSNNNPFFKLNLKEFEQYAFDCANTHSTIRKFSTDVVTKLLISTGKEKVYVFETKTGKKYLSWMLLSKKTDNLTAIQVTPNSIDVGAVNKNGNFKKNYPWIFNEFDEQGLRKIKFAVGDMLVDMIKHNQQ